MKLTISKNYFCEDCGKNADDTLILQTESFQKTTIILCFGCVLNLRKKLNAVIRKRVEDTANEKDSRS